VFPGAGQLPAMSGAMNKINSTPFIFPIHDHSGFDVDQLNFRRAPADAQSPPDSGEDYF
jgi:hypothetical protein